MFDKEKVKARLQQDTEFEEDTIQVFCNSINKIHPDLYGVVNDWLAGRHSKYCFRETSLAEIMEKEECSYIEALFTMSVFIDNPELIGIFGVQDITQDFFDNSSARV